METIRSAGISVEVLIRALVRMIPVGISMRELSRRTRRKTGGKPEERPIDA